MISYHCAFTIVAFTLEAVPDGQLGPAVEHPGYIPELIGMVLIAGDDGFIRFTSRENPYLFRDTLLKLINSENLPYQLLTQRS